MTERIQQCSNIELKKKVNIQVQEQGREVWRQRMEGKSSLIWYMGKTNVRSFMMAIRGVTYFLR